MKEYLKYLDWKWYDWMTVLPLSLWVILITMVMSPAIIVEYMIMMIPRSIRENRFFERHDFGIDDKLEDYDDLDRRARAEIFEEQVFGNFLYRSKMVKIWHTLITFRKGGALR